MLYNRHKRPSQGGEPGIFYFFLTEKFIVPLMLNILFYRYVLKCLVR